MQSYKKYLVWQNFFPNFALAKPRTGIRARLGNEARKSRQTTININSYGQQH